MLSRRFKTRRLWFCKKNRSICFCWRKRLKMRQKGKEDEHRSKTGFKSIFFSITNSNCVNRKSKIWKFDYSYRDNMCVNLSKYTSNILIFINRNKSICRGDRGYMGQGLDGTSQFSACSRNIFFIIFIPYMGINITHTEKNFHRNCTSSL